MSTNAMKLELIEWLARLKDPGVLAAMLQWKKANETADWYNDLSAAQKQSIEQGLSEAAEGKTVASEDVWKRYGQQPED